MAATTYGPGPTCSKAYVPSWAVVTLACSVSPASTTPLPFLSRYNSIPTPGRAGSVPPLSLPLPSTSVKARPRTVTILKLPKSRPLWFWPLDAAKGYASGSTGAVSTQPNGTTSWTWYVPGPTCAKWYAPSEPVVTEATSPANPGPPAPPPSRYSCTVALNPGSAPWLLLPLPFRSLNSSPETVRFWKLPNSSSPTSSPLWAVTV